MCCLDVALISHHSNFTSGSLNSTNRGSKMSTLTGSSCLTKGLSQPALTQKLHCLWNSQEKVLPDKRTWVLLVLPEAYQRVIIFCNLNYDEHYKPLVFHVIKHWKHINQKLLWICKVKKKRLGIKVLIIVFLGQILYRDNISECKTDYLHGSNRHRSQEKFIRGI